MSETDSAPNQAVDMPVTGQLPLEEDPQVESGATEQATEESDEQKNARLLAEREERSKKRAEGIQRRFNELTAEKRALAEQNARMLALLEQQQRQGLAPAKAPAADEGPKPEQYQGDYEGYVAAKAAWVAERRAEARIAQYEQQRQQVSARTQAEHQIAQLASRLQADLDKVRSEDPTFDENLSNLDIDAPPSMHMAILNAESPGRVLHALMRNPAEARRIASLSPIQQAHAIGKIEAGLASVTSSMSKAPAPAKPLGAKTGASASEPPEDPESYMAWAAKHLR